MGRPARAVPGCVLAVHGGAGAIRRADVSSAQESRCRGALERALEAGYAILNEGGASLAAVEAAIVALEDSGIFNAGRGAVCNAEGEYELDASIMDGESRAAGAVACARHVKNPILAARAVMRATDHVLLAGEGADAFARREGLAVVDESYFDSARKRAALQMALRRRRAHSAEEAHGTVGAVALDRHGNLAAGTSTGGVTGKLPGRVGDSPVVGAGTYADNGTCAVSGTGYGEYYIRAALTHDVTARMRYLREPLARAAERALQDVARLGGQGGLIAIDRRGRVVMPFNTEGMYRGCITRDGKASVAMFR
jgi:isoaspartyl peptidase/L-asparaginase-like protein (Ntn-hydrolase superfamily)